MLVALFIIVDEDTEDPIYADPDPAELDGDLWDRVCELVQDVAEGDSDPEGCVKIDKSVLGWRFVPRNGIAFIAIVEGVPPNQVEKYLKHLQRQYFDEVDDVRRPEREGVADVVVDVIPPWEEDED